MKTMLSALRLLLLFPVARRHLVHLGFLALFSTWLLPFWGQRHEGLFHTSKAQSARFRALEWNVENLYDTLHDVGFDDREFLPNSERRWNTPRYFHKQSSLAKTILAAGGLQPVDLVALCEVENDSVMHFLCRRTRLARLGYEYLVTHSADRRGIDVALLYQPETFALLHSETYRVPYDSLRERPTRDLLHAAGRLPFGDTLDVFVVHFPSRRGGASISEPYRLRAAGILRHLADSIARCRHTPRLLAMGDFNDEPHNASVSRVLAPTFAELTSHATPLPAEGHDDIEGSYYFRGEWSRIDQILVSPTLLSPTMKFHTPVCSSPRFPTFARNTRPRHALQTLPHLPRSVLPRGHQRPFTALHRLFLLIAGLSPTLVPKCGQREKEREHKQTNSETSNVRTAQTQRK